MSEPAGWVAGAGRVAGQLVAYALFAVTVGYLAGAPAYTYLGPDQAQIRLSFSHAGSPVRACRRLSPEEIAALPPNMRRPLDCPRERVALRLELDLDEQALYRATLRPSGLAGDGSASVYARFAVPVGRHRLAARLRDSTRAEGFDYQHEAEVVLAAGENFVIGFDENRGGLRFLPGGRAR